MRRFPRFLVEALEERSLLSAVYPTNNEQYLVELINRGRANPAAEATRYGTDLNEGLAAGTITTVAKQPLAINPYLTDAARGHSQWMIDNNTFSHGGAGGSTPDTRMTAAGYTFGNDYTWAENIAWSGTTGSAPNQTTATASLHAQLYVDQGVSGRGHRINLMNGDVKEIGAGVLSGVFQGYNAVMVTEDFARTGTTSFLTGVMYKDNDANNFYTPGEGIGSATITATPVGGGTGYSTTTFSSGGYSLRLPAGTYKVVANSATLGGTETFNSVVVGTQNVKLDFTKADTPLPVDTPPKGVLSAPSLTRAGATTYTFSVTYTDNNAVDISTLDSGDLLVTGPKSYSQYAKFVRVDLGTDGAVRKATYQITAPGGYWDSTDNGAYAITLRASQVADTAGHYATSVKLGTLTVAAPATGLPTAWTAGGGNITTKDATTYTFQVKYSDDTGILVGDLDGKDILVTGPKGFSRAAVFVSVDVNSNGQPRWATYRIGVPGGSWDKSDNGTYTISLRANAVRDVSGNYIAPKVLRTFTVTIA